MQSTWLILLCLSFLAGAYAVSDEYVQTLADLVNTLDRDLRQLKKTIPQIEENVIIRVDMSQHDLRAEILKNMVSRRMARDLQLRQNQMKRQHQGMFREIIKLKKQLSVCLAKNDIKRFTTRIENLEKMTNSNDIYGAVNNLQEQKGNNSTLEANYMALRTNALEATEAKLETAKALLQTQQLDYVSAIEKLKTDLEMKHNDTANNIVQLEEGFRNITTEIQATKDDLGARLQEQQQYFSSLNTSVNDEIQALATDLETKTTLQTLNTRLQEQQQKCSFSINAVRSDLATKAQLKTLNDRLHTNQQLLSQIRLIVGCPDKWTENKGSCYYLSEDTATYATARNLCEQRRNAYLAIPETPDENSFLKNFVKQKKGHVPVWIGGNNQKTDGIWRWTGTDEIISYTDWCPGEPNNKFVERCLQYYAFRNCDYGWNDNRCIEEYHYLCETRIK